MKTKLILAASAVLLSGPVFAQEPMEKSGSSPSTTMQSPPASNTPEPMDKSGTEPSTNMQAAPQPSTAPEPLDKSAAAPMAAPVGVLIIGELRKTEDDNKMVTPLGATVDRVEDMDIYDASGKKIAEVESLLEDKNGEIKGVAIEYGGFLGIGEKAAVMTLDQVKQKDGNLVTEVTEEQLPDLPVWHHD